MRAVSRLSINALAGRRKRTALLIGAVALSTALVAAIACAMASMNAGIEKRVARTVGVADILIRHVAKDRFPAAVLDVLRADSRIELAVPRTREPVWLSTISGDTRAAVTLEGIDLVLDAQMYPTEPSEGRRPGTDEEVVLRDRAAEVLGVKLGDEIVAGEGEHAMRLRIVGIIRTPAMDIFDKPGGEASLATVQHVTGAGGSLRSIGAVVREDADPRAVAQELAKAMPPDVMVRESERVTGRIDGLVRVNRMLFLCAAALGYVGAAIIVLTGLTTAVLERQRELAMIRCVGGTPAQLAGAQLGVGLFIGAIGAIVGLPLGVFLAWIMARVFPDRLSAGLIIPPAWLIWAAVGAAFSGVLGAAWPAIRASRARPITAMASRARPATIAGMIVAGVVGIALICGEAFLIGNVKDAGSLFPMHPFVTLPMVLTGWFLLAVPVTGLMARVAGPIVAGIVRVPADLVTGSMRASPYRSGFTAGALMVGLAMMTAVYTNGTGLLRDWIDAIRFPDAFVNGVFVGITPEMREKLEELDFVERTCAVTLLKIDSKAFGLDRLIQPKTNFIAFEPDPFFEMTRLHWVAGDPEHARHRLNEGGAVLVSQEFLVHRTDYAVGSTYTIEYGGKRHDFEIVGVVSSPGLDLVSKYFNMEEDFSENAIHAVFGTRADLRRVFGTDAIHLLQIQLKGPITDTEAVARMREAAGTPGLYFGSARSIKEGIYFIGRGMMTIATVVAFGAMVIGCAGVVNVVVAGIDARRFEFGVLRSVGASGGTVGRLILGEVVVIALAACVLGLGLGLQVSWAENRIYALLLGLEIKLIPPVVPLLGACALLIGITTLSVTPVIIGIARKKPRVLLASTRG